MANKTESALTESQMRILNAMSFCVIVTFDDVKRWPVSHAISWVQAPDAETVRFAIASRSYISTLLERERIGSLVFFEGGVTYSLTFSELRRFEPVASPKLQLHFFEASIDEVRNISFYGVHVEPPTLEKTYDYEVAQRLDEEVRAALSQE